jgi:Cytochrome C oxidase, cbb3-type, subunit III
MKRKRMPLFWSTLATILFFYLLVKVGIPYISMLILGRPAPIPTPTAITVIYMSLVLVGAFLYITTHEEKMEEFSRPVIAFLKGGGNGYQRGARLALLGLFPLLVGWVFYSQTAPIVQPPAGIRIQHPTIPQKYASLANPFRDPSDEIVKKYIEEKNLGNIGIQEARAKLVRDYTDEGRILFQMNCRPCHGSKADGNGPMAWGFRLRPANFTDPGTIATVVEQFVFWRVNEGGRGLPVVATPWDSAMPRWKDELTAEQIWKIIMGEYDTAGVIPRRPEKLQ